MTPTFTDSPTRPDNLALIFQELFTAVARLRAGRQNVADAASFRHQFKSGLQLAEANARQVGHSSENTRLAIFALVAFLDESILNLRSPVFAEWPGKPLQEELFGVHIAGEIFFQNIERLLQQQDSSALGDILEIYLLALQLGFQGRYSFGSKADLAQFENALRARLRRIRGPLAEWSLAWRPGNAAVPAPPSDPWQKRFLWIAIACVSLAILSYVLYFVLLRGSVSDLIALVPSGK
jgi:type VI secretion system protein ImpK